MASCAYCGTTILFGGVKDKDLRFCNNECYQKGRLIAMSQGIPKGTVDQQVRSVHRGTCPKCQGSGPIDVHTSYRVYSALVYTSWSSIPKISCRSCGIKSQIGNTLFSLVLGWWGFPWGIIMTPIQIVRNVAGMIKGPDETRPSDKLQNIVRLQLVSQVLQPQQR